MALTQKYLEEHAANAQNYETIGRNIAALILREASAKLASDGTDTVESTDINLTVKLTQYLPMLCVKAEVCAPFVGCTSIHVGA